MATSWAEMPNGHLLVDSDWLANHLNDPDLRIFDCTTRLVPDEELGYRIADARDNWTSAHIPGSGYLNCQDDMCDTSHRHRFMLADPASFAASVGTLGIGDDTSVVLYSTAELFWATRAWWALYANGFDNAFVLHGGFQSWTAEDRPVSTEPCSTVPPNCFGRPAPGGRSTRTVSTMHLSCTADFKAGPPKTGPYRPSPAPIHPPHSPRTGARMWC